VYYAEVHASVMARCKSSASDARCWHQKSLVQGLCAEELMKDIQKVECMWKHYSTWFAKIARIGSRLEQQDIIYKAK
jgi:hypothetical protein